MQLFNLDSDPSERNNLAGDEPERVAALLRLLDEQVRRGRCTPGAAVSNDREVEVLPQGVELPGGD